MVFRLASRYVIWMQIIIWGKGFAEFVMKKFENEENWTNMFEEARLYCNERL